MKLIQEHKEGIWTYYQLAQKESLDGASPSLGLFA